MVQLSSRYDSTLKKKVFILKGDEAYARTTDVIATVNTDFNDYTSHINYFHIGLEIEVLRELGESSLYLYVNDEHIHAIPYNDSDMDEVIDEDWNEKGVYWINNKLVIGMKDDSQGINTGLYLPYEVENKIRIEYMGNKYCLSSAIHPISLLVPTPDAFQSTLTLSSDSARYSPNATIDDVELLFECENETQESKTVRVYDGNTLLTTETVTQDIPVTLDLGEFDDGLHTLKAVFDGDDEAYYSETTYQISVGYKITNLVYPSYIIQGNAGTLSCKVSDYLDAPVYDEAVAVMEYIPNWGWEAISQTDYPSSDGTINIEPVYYSTRPFAVAIGQWTGSEHTMNIINITSLSINLTDPYVEGISSTDITGAVYSNGTVIPVNGIKIWFNATDINGNEYEWDTVTRSDGTYTTHITYFKNYTGKVTITGQVANTLVQNTADWHILQYHWDINRNKQYGNVVTNNVTITKRNNGFKFNNPNYTNGSATFSYGSGKWVTEFDMIDPDSTAWSESTFNGLDWADEQYEIGSPFHMRIEHDADNTMRWYADNELVKTSTNNTRAFVIGLNRAGVIINNLKIERIE